MTFSCPSCGNDVRTRVLADAVTLVVVGHCEAHGVQEVSRVYVGEIDDSVPAAVHSEEDVATYPVEYLADHVPAASSAYRPGECCGRRLGEWSWCRLPANHNEPHAA